jgi:hypothetical protein
MILLAAEQGLKVPQIALIVRESEATVLRWLKRYRPEGVEGLQDGAPPWAPFTYDRSVQSRPVGGCAPPPTELRAAVLRVNAPALGRFLG